MPIKESFITRLNNAEILVIGASYSVNDDYAFWKTKDVNYIGFAKIFGVSDNEEVQFFEGNPLDTDWNDVDIVNTLNACLQHKVFKEIYIDRATIKHIQGNLDSILTCLFKDHLAVDGKFYFPAYQEPKISCGTNKLYPGITDKDYERLKNILGPKSVQQLEEIRLDRENWMTGNFSLYSMCKNPLTNSQAIEHVEEVGQNYHHMLGAGSSSNVNNHFLISDMELALRLQRLEFDQIADEDQEIARKLQLEFDQEAAAHRSSLRYI